jgi:hypothetical protein
MPSEIRNRDIPERGFLDPLWRKSLTLATSLRANGSRECAPDDRLHEAIHGAAK